MNNLPLTSVGIVGLGAIDRYANRYPPHKKRSYSVRM
jgi:hypothetical protein